MSMGDDDIQKEMFIARVMDYVNNSNKRGDANSPVFNMLNTCVRFDLLETVLEMALGFSHVVHKWTWPKAGRECI